MLYIFCRRTTHCYTLVSVLVLCTGTGIARGQYYWILDIGCLAWYRSNPTHHTHVGMNYPLLSGSLTFKRRLITRLTSLATCNAYPTVAKQLPTPQRFDFLVDHSVWYKFIVFYCTVVYFGFIDRLSLYIWIWHYAGIIFTDVLIVMIVILGSFMLI